VIGMDAFEGFAKERTAAMEIPELVKTLL